MAAALPFVQALAPLVGSLFAPSPPEPPAPVPPPAPPSNPEPESNKDANVEVDQEASRQRMLKRRRASQLSGLSLLSSDGGNSNSSSGTLTGY